MVTESPMLLAASLLLPASLMWQARRHLDEFLLGLLFGAGSAALIISTGQTVIGLLVYAFAASFLFKKYYIAIPLLTAVVLGASTLIYVLLSPSMLWFPWGAPPTAAEVLRFKSTLILVAIICVQILIYIFQRLEPVTAQISDIGERYPDM